MTDPASTSREPADTRRNGRLVERLYRDHRSSLRSIARRGGIANEQLDDVVHTALAAVIAAYRGPADPEQLFSYAATAVRNACAKAHRRRGRKESHDVAMSALQQSDGAGGSDGRLVDLEAGDPADVASRRERVKAARRRLERLPRIEREILVLGAAGYGNPEIAAIVGLSERAVRKRVTRARRRLA